jgi:PAS domain S-box-containing protein
LRTEGRDLQHRDLQHIGLHGPISRGLGFLHGAGSAGELIRGLDATNSPLGPPEFWSATLRCVLGIALPSRAQIAIFWGEDQLAVYNDAFAPSLGSMHPRAMGRPAREAWGEMWDGLGPMLEGVRRGGETVAGQDMRFLADRHGYREEVFFDISCSAVHEDEGVAGVMCVVSETTGRVLADRRLRALRAAGLRLAAAAGIGEACAAALEAIAAENPADLPWGRMLLAGEAGLSVVAAHGAAPGVPLAMEAPMEALEAVLRDGLPRELPGALALPLMAGSAVVGIFLAGLNPYQRLAGDYGSYLGLATGQVSFAIARLRRAEEEERGAALLRESESLFRTMADHVPVMIWMTEPDGRCCYLNRRWYAHTGQEPGAGLGLGWMEAVHPEDRAGRLAVATPAIAARRPFQIEYRLRCADGSYTWVIDSAAPRLDAEGRFSGYIGSVLDIGDRRRAEEARDLLARELSHRIKNIFMVTGGLAALTARGDPAAEVFAALLQARLRALSLAHDLVRPELGAVPSGGGSTVHGLLRALLAPYAEAPHADSPLAASGGVRVAVEGQDAPMGYVAASTLALVLHEQATNAVKYGALSRPSGRVRIVTRMGAGVLELEWIETGGPAVTGPPVRQGFGTVLAGRSLRGQVQGHMEHDWRAEGLVMRLFVPAAGLAR